MVVRGVDEDPQATLGPFDLSFARADDGSFETIVGLSVDQAPGALTLGLRATDGTGEVDLEGFLEVLPPGFAFRELRVARRFVSPSAKERRRVKSDQAAFNSAFAQAFGPRRFAGDFLRPRPSATTAPFGDVRVFNGRRQSQHYGTDMDGDTGSPIWAANDGVVVMARDCFTSGNTVLVDHGLGIFTAYFHLSAFEVTKGQRVKRGQSLGRVGKTGRATGPHLHFGAKVDGRWVDPEALLKLRFERDVSGRSTSGAASQETR